MSDKLSDLSKRVFGRGTKPWWDIRPDTMPWPQFAIHPFDQAPYVKPYALPVQPEMNADKAVSVPQEFMDRSRYPDTLSEYHPSWRENFVDLLAKNSRPKTWWRETMERTFLEGPPGPLSDVSLVDWTPLAMPFVVDEIRRSLKAGNYWRAALEAIGLIPAGKVASSINKMRKARKALAPVQLQSKGGSIYPPPKVEPVPFSADYPGNIPADINGRLTHTMDGDPLVAKYVAGRREAGGPNIALNDEEWQDIIRLITKKPVQYGPKSIFQNPKSSVGAFNHQDGVRVWDQLQSPQKELVTMHEGAHGIDHYAGKPVKLHKSDKIAHHSSIPEAKNSKTELKTIYNDLNNSYLYAARQKDPNIDPKKVYLGTNVTPESLPFKYEGKEADLERMAEAIRAYGSNPDYMKKIAPKTAKQIRKFVNSNKVLKNIIQFNSLIPGAASASALWNILEMYSNSRDDKEM